MENISLLLLFFKVFNYIKFSDNTEHIRLNVEYFYLTEKYCVFVQNKQFY